MKTKMENMAMKTKEELNALKEEVESVNKKLSELADEKLTDEELDLVTGGNFPNNSISSDGYIDGGIIYNDEPLNIQRGSVTPNEVLSDIYSLGGNTGR